MPPSWEGSTGDTEPPTDERLAEHVRKVVDTFQPLISEQRDKITTLPRGPVTRRRSGGGHRMTEPRATAQLGTGEEHRRW